jgi:hypothetical protein
MGTSTCLLLARSRGVVDETLFYSPMSSSSSSLRGGGGYIMLPSMAYSSTMTIAPTTPRHNRGSKSSARQNKDGRQQRRMGPLQFGLMVVQRSIDDVGSKIQVVVEDVIVKQWSGLQDNLGREWFKLLLNIEKIFSPHQRQQHHHNSIISSSKKLDDVIHAFQSVLDSNGKEATINTARLLKACRAHLVLMKSGGPALRVVAKDMETNLLKAETLLWTLSNKRQDDRDRDLVSFLQTEIDSGVHPDVNVLEESSAAMGLLWIRRSLAYQSELYASLSSPPPSSSSSSSSSGSGSGVHPKDAALQAYNKTLLPYHGWLLQKVFPLSLSQMPDRQVFLAKFGGREVHELDAEYERIIEMKLQLLVRIWQPILDVWRREFERLNLEDTRRA